MPAQGLQGSTKGQLSLLQGDNLPPHFLKIDFSLFSRSCSRAGQLSPLQDDTYSDPTQYVAGGPVIIVIIPIVIIKTAHYNRHSFHYHQNKSINLRTRIQ